MKKLNLLVLRTFAGPMVLTFFISLFVLLMQFLWKYIDDLVGKGMDWFIILKLMIYVSVTLVPLALPLSLLLSSLMTFGNLAEHFEITASKSAGISLQKIMRPLILTAIAISLSAFYFSNFVLPVANLKMNALLYDVRQQKPALLIKEGVFYNGIDGYSIRIGKKEKDGQTLSDIMIYDHSENRGNTKLIIAESGRMVMSDDERYLILNLSKGSSYEEQENKPGRFSHPLMRTEFEEETLRFDLSSFKMTRTNEQLFKDNYQMLNLWQLGYASDSLEKRINDRHKDLFKMISGTLNIDTGKIKTAYVEALPDNDLLKNFPVDRRKFIVSSAIYASRNTKNMIDEAVQDLEMKSKSLAKHQIEWQRKFTLPFACLILFFIGAPLGAIIKKGGLGTPVVVSIIFFLTYHVISISGEKFAREVVIPAWKGMWISSIILLPIGIFLTYKATTDSALFDKDTYLKFFQRIFRKS